MRARNIKPSLFKNEVLGTADPLITILFEGLWCAADREGRIEDRPLRLKAEIFPYREGLNIGGMLNWLDGHSFIHRYTVEGVNYIQVSKFREHQRPHSNEVASTLPSMDEADATDLQLMCNLGEQQSPPKETPLRSDSGFLIPDSPSLIPDCATSASTTPARKKVSRDDFDWWLDFKLAYPERAGDQGWRKAQRAAHARISEGHTNVEFIEGAKRYAAYCEAIGKNGTEFVKQAATFLGPEKPFLEPWTAPPPKINGHSLVPLKLKTAEEWEAIERARGESHA